MYVDLLQDLILDRHIIFIILYIFKMFIFWYYHIAWK